MSSTRKTRRITGEDTYQYKDHTFFKCTLCSVSCIYFLLENLYGVLHKSVSCSCGSLNCTRLCRIFLAYALPKNILKYIRSSMSIIYQALSFSKISLSEKLITFHMKFPYLQSREDIMPAQLRMKVAKQLLKQNPQE